MCAVSSVAAYVSGCGAGGWKSGNEMLLCDSEGCAGAHHLNCLAPPLAAVPEGSWFCPSCASAADCGQCSACLDMPKFGGAGTRKARCFRKPRSSRANLPCRVAPRRAEMRVPYHARALALARDANDNESGAQIGRAHV